MLAGRTNIYRLKIHLVPTFFCPPGTVYQGLSQVHCTHSFWAGLTKALRAEPAVPGRDDPGKGAAECSFCLFLRSVSEVSCYPPRVFNWHIESIWEILWNVSLKALMPFSTTSVGKYERASQFPRNGTVSFQLLEGEWQKLQACWGHGKVGGKKAAAEERAVCLCWATSPRRERSIMQSSLWCDSDTFNRYSGRARCLLAGLFSVMKRCWSS